MNIERPPWNSAEPKESLAAMAEWLNEQARQTFVRDKTHIELYFLMDENGEGGILPVTPGLDKDQLAAMLRQQIAALGIYAFLHVAESWFYLPTGALDRTSNRLAEGEVDMAKPPYAGERAEVLIVHVESRDGYFRFWVNPIVRSKDTVALSEPVEIKDLPKGRFAGLFKA